MNSIYTTEAELYQYLNNNNMDVLMLQETKVKRWNIVKKLGSINYLQALPKNHKGGGYLSGGLVTIAMNNMVMKKDQNNTSDCIFVSDLLLDNKGSSSSVTQK